ncbi:MULTISPECIES: CBS domain-containing protein [unclassified Nocardia]|uniref:CBS domain-containing protein n=1 Tax=unclassified Nocardia TaxID=2637762 RepID=UPI001CE45863|nr:MULTISPECIES: CBS domain-containing protein [unclassified Nocardia]
MKRRTVADVMTREVVSVSASTPFREVVRTLAVHRISGAPVLDRRGRVIGVVSESDLLGKQARDGGAWIGSFWMLVRHRSRLSPVGLTAHDLMKTPAVTVRPDDRLTVAAATLARHGIKRVPVLDDSGALVGILARRDVLSVYDRTDADLVAEIETEVLEHSMYLEPGTVTVESRDGVVTLRGKVERQSMIGTITALTAAVDGIVDVRNELTADYDDTDIPPPPPVNVGVFARHKDH